MLNIISSYLIIKVRKLTNKFNIMNISLRKISVIYLSIFFFLFIIFSFFFTGIGYMLKEDVSNRIIISNITYIASLILTVLFSTLQITQEYHEIFKGRDYLFLVKHIKCSNQIVASKFLVEYILRQVLFGMPIFGALNLVIYFLFLEFSILNTVLNFLSIFVLSELIRVVIIYLMYLYEIYTKQLFKSIIGFLAYLAIGLSSVYLYCVLIQKKTIVTVNFNEIDRYIIVMKMGTVLVILILLIFMFLLFGKNRILISYKDLVHYKNKIKIKRYKFQSLTELLVFKEITYLLRDNNMWVILNYIITLNSLLLGAVIGIKIFGIASLLYVLKFSLIISLILNCDMLLLLMGGIHKIEFDKAIIRNIINNNYIQIYLKSKIVTEICVMFFLQLVVALPIIVLHFNISSIIMIFIIFFIVTASVLISFVSNILKPNFRFTENEEIDGCTRNFIMENVFKSILLLVAFTIITPLYAYTHIGKISFNEFFIITLAIFGVIVLILFFLLKVFISNQIWERWKDI